ncbi:hypothetical protein DFH08DRAFT_819669 [Mycena albidolilacea]|uniref:Uncharacterized protein n=1 Tax=Mycena albidolilacea TaxID=1033008 RepID=A0AAD7EFD3_9AGAR|nr:hypothetical protein DFH08DRAFT_819669 [Mycena albidolilacea]
MSGRSTHGTPQVGARPQRTETSTPQGQASILPRECDRGVGGVECGVQSQAFQTCLAAQPMAFHKSVQDHREPRHPHHRVKPVYYPEKVTEVLEVLNVESNHKHSRHVWPLSPWHSTNWCKTTKKRDIHTMRVAAQIEFYSDRGEGGTMRPVDRHMATEVQKDTVQLLGTRAGKQHLNMRDSRGVRGSGGIGGRGGVGGGSILHCWWCRHRKQVV